MSDSEIADPEQTGADVVSVAFERLGQSSLGAEQSERLAPKQASFDRRELQTILDLYGRRVAEGEWRDYAIDFSPIKAVFAVFRRTSETPLYTIEKTPSLARRQGAFDDRVARRGWLVRWPRVLVIRDGARADLPAGSCG